jgi:hypothetical protein
MRKKATITKSFKIPSTFPLAVREVAGIKITIQSPGSLYIHLNDYVYYIDDTTKEQFIAKWNKNDQE